MKWIHVGDQLPQKTEWVLVCQGGAMNCCGYNDKTGWFEDWVGMSNSNIIFSLITHWRHLPKPPKDYQTGEVNEVESGRERVK